MAKYSLILKDQTFIRLMQVAAEKRLTFGKYVNDILNKLAEGSEVKENKLACFVCGEKPKLEVHGFNGVPLYLCKSHQGYKNIGQGWSDLGA